MTDVDRLHRHLEERARIATVEATPVTSVVRRAKQRDRRRRTAIGALGVAAVGGLAVGALWMGGSHDTEVRSVDSSPGTLETTPNALLPVDSSPATLPATTTAATTALPTNGWVAQNVRKRHLGRRRPRDGVPTVELANAGRRARRSRPMANG